MTESALRTAPLGITNALKQLVRTSGALEQEAQATRAALAKRLAALEAEQKANLAVLGNAKAASIAQLVAEREALLRTFQLEVHLVETDSNFSLASLLETLVEKRLVEERLERVSADAAEAQEAHKAHAASAQKAEQRLSAEIAKLKLAVKQMGSALADERNEKQEAMARQAKQAQSLEAELSGTRTALSGQLHQLASEKEARERELQAESAAVAVAKKEAERRAAEEVARLQREKAEREAGLVRQLKESEREAQRQASALQAKIDKMRRLQELALGAAPEEDGGGKGGGGGGTHGDGEGIDGYGSSSAPEDAAAARIQAASKSGALVRGGAFARRVPTSQGRQLLYWESLKSSRREQSSMSWRGQDVFAHEDAPAIRPTTTPGAPAVTSTASRQRTPRSARGGAAGPDTRDRVRDSR